MVEADRIKCLNSKDIMDRPDVIYWMQSSQRIEYNHAFEFALESANNLGKNLIVYFGITENYPQANERHYYFMLEGLKEIKRELEKINVRMLILKNSPEAGILKLLNHAAMIVVDRGYLKHEISWRSHVAEASDCSVVQVETNVIVPVEAASSKEEYSAATLRRKLEKIKERFLNVIKETEYMGAYETDKNFPKEIDIEDVDAAIAKLNIDKSVGQISQMHGGTLEAKARLEVFLKERLYKFDSKRNDPSEEYCSNLSPYLHFGQISPLYVYLKVLNYQISSAEMAEGRKAFLEELFVRRELAMNFVYYNKNYDSYECLPEWALKTLSKHSDDRREYIYETKDFEFAKTHDEYWNAAQLELLKYGKMHGYMRMYWGKKILEWSETPQSAYDMALYLNNKYEIDGRDPNGFAGIAWCFGKHDRPWGEREIFGNVRCMVYSGLKRKFNMAKYVQKLEPFSHI